MPQTPVGPRPFRWHPRIRRRGARAWGDARSTGCPGAARTPAAATVGVVSAASDEGARSAGQTASGCAPVRVRAHGRPQDRPRLR